MNVYLINAFVVGNRSGEYACTAYVTFKDAFALQTAILLSVSWWSLYPANASRMKKFVIQSINAITIIDS